MGRAHLYIGTGIALGSLLTAGWLRESPSVAIAVLSCGAVLGSVAFLLPALSKCIEGAGSVVLGPSGLKIHSQEWTVQTDEPIRTFMPPQPTNETNSEMAISACDEGRRIVSAGRPGEPVDLERALACFEEAATLDPEYWEPRINIAQVFLLRQELEQALALATDVRVRFAEHEQAFAKAGLIIAKVLELRIPAEATVEQRRKGYSAIVGILKDSLRKCAGHMTTRTSLGRALLLSGVGQSKLVEYLGECMGYESFRLRFREALVADGLMERFRETLPEFELDS